MRKKPLVSILIASYNKEKYVNRCINSCKNQNYRKVEIIFYDDGSSDNSYNIAKKIKGVKAYRNQKKVNQRAFNTYYQINSYLFLKTGTEEQASPNIKLLTTGCSFLVIAIYRF